MLDARCVYTFSVQDGWSPSSVEFNNYFHLGYLQKASQFLVIFIGKTAKFSSNRFTFISGTAKEVTSHSKKQIMAFSNFLEKDMLINQCQINSMPRNGFFDRDQ